MTITGEINHTMNNEFRHYGQEPLTHNPGYVAVAKRFSTVSVEVRWSYLDHFTPREFIKHILPTCKGEMYK